MTSMRAADRCDSLRMARRSEPVVNGRPDLAALDRGISRAVMPGNKQNHALAGGDRPFERAVDCSPGRIEAHPVEIDDAIGLDRARTKPFVPASVERVARLRAG